MENPYCSCKPTQLTPHPPLQVLVIVLVTFPQQAWLASVEGAVHLFCLCFFTFEIALGVTATTAAAYISLPWNKVTATAYSRNPCAEPPAAAVS